MKFAWACSSGSAAVHCAIAAINPEPGDEIITTSITDMGALTPIMYQGAIPVFADVDPHTYNVTAETYRRPHQPKNQGDHRHPFVRQPLRHDRHHGAGEQAQIPVIEDTAQSFMATHHGKFVGTFGTDRLLQPAAGQAHHHR